MIEGTMADSTPSGSDGQFAALELSTWSVPIFRSLVDNLIKCGEDIVTELYLGYGCVPYCSDSNRKSCNTLLR